MTACRAIAAGVLGPSPEHAELRGDEVDEALCWGNKNTKSAAKCLLESVYLGYGREEVLHEHVR